MPALPAGYHIYKQQNRQAAGNRETPEIHSLGSDVMLARMALWLQEEQRGNVALGLEVLGARG